MTIQKITNYMIRNGIVPEMRSEFFMCALDDTFHQAKIVGTILCIMVPGIQTTPYEKDREHGRMYQS
ncbi:hypothetical protein D3Z48_19955, partial [Clostridiaceae bacterium]|nr:hypothetical protein [Clostridiaceae bacterium]